MITPLALRKRYGDDRVDQEFLKKYFSELGDIGEIFKGASCHGIIQLGNFAGPVGVASGFLTKPLVVYILRVNYQKRQRRSGSTLGWFPIGPSFGDSGIMGLNYLACRNAVRFPELESNPHTTLRLLLSPIPLFGLIVYPSGIALGLLREDSREVIILLGRQILSEKPWLENRHYQRIRQLGTNSLTLFRSLPDVVRAKIQSL